MKVDKLSVSFESELGDAVRSAAAQAGKPLSAWLAEAAASKLRAEALDEFLSGWQAEHGGVTVGLHERGLGPGDRFALPYFAVPDLPAALEQVRSLGGEIVHPGERWAICRDSEGTPFGLAARAPT